MPKLSFTATKMSDAKVSHISLVERGANRIPFKVVKEENEMKGSFAGLDLGGLFARKAEKPVEQQPQVIAVATMMGDKFEAVKASVEKAGFAVADLQEMDDGSIIFKQEGCTDDALASGVVVRLSESVALVTKGFSPYSMDITDSGVSFADQCAANGFYPTVSSIMNTLSDAVRAVVYAASSPADAKSAITKLFTEASAYTASFVGTLPVKAFKLEEEAAALDAVPAVVTQAAEGSEEAVEKAAKKPVVDPNADPAAAGGADETDPMKGKAKGCKKAEGEESEDEDDEGGLAQKADTSLTVETVATMIAAKVEEATGGVVSKLEELLGKFDAVQKSVSGFETTVGELRDRTEKAEKVAADSVKAVKGTVVAGSESGDAVPGNTSKSETSPRGDIDTAFSPRRPFPGRR